MQTAFIIFFLVSIRVAAMLISSPVFSVRQIPAMVKVGLSIMIGYIVTMVSNFKGVVVPNSNIELVLACGKEVIIGVSIGFIATMIFNSIRVSAQLMDFSVGFSMAQYYDPSTAGNSTPLERFFNWFAIVIFFTFNFHHIILNAVIKSFQIIPPGVYAVSITSYNAIFASFFKSILLAVQLAAPIIIVLFITDFTLGLISRAVPQIHIFILGMPIKVLVGLLAIATILPGLTRIYIKAFENMSVDILKYFNAFPFIMLMAADDKTEEPTAKKLQDARKKGQVPKSVDLNSGLTLLFIAIVFSVYGEQLYTNGRVFINQCFNFLSVENLDMASVKNIFIFMLKNGVIAAAPIILTVMTIGIISNIAQTGFMLSSEGMKPKFDKINPIQGFKRIFSKRTIMELLKTMLKVSLIAYIAYSFVKGKIFDILKTSDLNPSGIYPFVKDITDSQLVRMVIVILLIGVADYIFQKRQFKKDMKMSKQEVKEEYKQMEGDPQIKSKIRQKQREMAMRRMMQEVPKATVVVTNPTHFAVALKYEKEKDSAPLIVAKGADLVAFKIKEIAKENKVPIVENKTLARTLYARADINEQVPVELYQAVAEIIAYVYSLKKV